MTLQYCSDLHLEFSENTDFHNNTPDFSIGHTQLLTIRAGYIRYNEHLLFSPKKIITL